MEVRSLVEQLRAIERQYAPPEGTTAAAYATQLAAWRNREPDHEETCSTRDATGAWLLLRLCARYGVRPFRRPRQRPTTICLRAPRGFVSKILWPQMQAMAQVFELARVQIVDELSMEWLGKEIADEILTLDEEPEAGPG